MAIDAAARTRLPASSSLGLNPTEATQRAVSRQTGHAAGLTFLGSYIRHASAFTDHAASTLGLGASSSVQLR